MLFNSIEFLIFFPMVTIIYFLLPHRFRWPELLIASCIFYMAFIPQYIFILLITILIDYLAAIFIEQSSGRRKKNFLIISILSTCTVLFIFKYFNFFTSNFNSITHFLNLDVSISAVNIILPIGLSFHTFQSLSYVIEVYYGRQKAEKHFGIYSLYVMFYPQLVAGPIERPQNLLTQLRIPQQFELVRTTSGLRLMLWGFFKKIVIADNLANVVNHVYDSYYQQNGITLLLATYFFAFQIYCDFSGYSDIAIGAARIMGIDLMTNFNLPYISCTVREFWTRWHISLSTWFRDYVYKPLGGNRKGIPRWFFNLFVTFLISGLWHGANWTFVIWGALNGFYLIAELVIKLLLPHLTFKSKWMHYVRIFLTFHLILFSWIFFRAPQISVAFDIIKTITTVPQNLLMYMHGHSFLTGLGDMAPEAIGKFILMIIVFYSIDYFRDTKFFLKIFHSSVAFRMFIYFLLFYVILFFGYFGETKFIYFQF